MWLYKFHITLIVSSAYCFDWICREFFIHFRHGISDHDFWSFTGFVAEFLITNFGSVLHHLNASPQAGDMTPPNLSLSTVTGTAGSFDAP